jgi:PAS domain S-box/diguanylate cyclase (GGDEF) domain
LKSGIKNLEKGFFVKYIIATLCLLSIFAISAVHSNYMDRKISDISTLYLSKLSQQNADILSSQIHSKLQTLNVIARMVGNDDDFEMGEISNVLESEVHNSDFISLGVVRKGGGFTFTQIAKEEADRLKLKPSHGEILDGKSLMLESDWDYINETMRGAVGLTGSPSRNVNGNMVNIYALPIYRGPIAGALIAFFDDEFFDDLIVPEIFDEKACSYIADRNGNIIYHSDGCNNGQFKRIIAKLSSGWSLEGKSGEKLRRDVKAGRGNTVEYEPGGDGLYVSYVPMNFHGWYLVSLTDTTIAKAQSKSIYDDIIPAFIYILIIILAVAGCFVYLRSKSFKRLERKMQIESINDESYRMIMEQTDDIIFEYDTIEKTYFHTANFKKNFGYEPTRTGFLGSLEYDYVHPDDVLGFAEMFEKMKLERKLTEAEIRIINSEGEYLWTRIYMLGVYDREGKLARVIGKIVNIHEKKKELQQLKEMAVTDSATGVYNKKTTEDMIRTFLYGEGKYGKHAMFMIDIDDFKGVNDDHGHRVGDTVITVLGAELNRIFRATDIKGRIGGDEFMVLMKDIEGMELIVSKASAICGIFENGEFESKKISVSASIGIAIYNKDGSTYEALYEAADRALYDCKNYQKGTFSFCKEADLTVSSR